MFTVDTRFGSYPNCAFNVGKYYDNGHIAIEIFSCEEGPLASLTVNIPGIELYPENYSCIDTNNFPEGKELVEKLGIAECCGKLTSGFCVYPICRFNVDKVKEYV